ncbi:ATP-NAD kinase family protein [Microbacterium sp. GXS0129]|uniref:ATP-NAD kinase family protein n=1 Tax=Microbacterium sp. GXS0129 TaxID=3377836 RepID=UPI00383BA07D
MIGLLVNPIAGVGGPAGFAGSDGVGVQQAALAVGSLPRAGSRAVAALRVLAAAAPDTRVLTIGGAMGEDAVREAGLTPVVVVPAGSPSTAADTVSAVGALRDAGVTLLLFAGGDGTARDIATALGPPISSREAPARRSNPATRGLSAAEGVLAVLGIPAGVKMYSAAFAVSPAAAGAIAAEWVASGGLPVSEADVLDADEEELRRGETRPRLFATLPIPVRPGRTQARKAASPADEHAAVRAAAAGAVSRMRPGVSYLLGPGSTMREVARQLGIVGTPVGVDVVRDGALVLAGASERDLLEIVAAGPAQAVVTVIGGQGFLLGRGNQQLSAAVLRGLGPDPLLVVAAEQKLIDLHGAPFIVDTGDATLDASLAGFVPVVTGAASTSIYPVSAPEGART